MGGPPLGVQRGHSDRAAMLVLLVKDVPFETKFDQLGPFGGVKGPIVEGRTKFGRENGG